MNTMMLGASGAIFAVLTAYGFIFPKNIVWIPPGIPLPAKFAVLVFAFIELFLGLSGLEPGVANFGHLGGIITGAAIMFIWRRRDSFKYKGFKNIEFVWE
jgi:membrane associated rhomboid family serine protease